MAEHVHNGRFQMEIRDYNGMGRWSADAVLERYWDYSRKLGIPVPAGLAPVKFTEGDVTWIYPIMDVVVVGIELGDKACIEIGIEFIEEDQRFPFGRIFKSRTARALRRAQLSEEQMERLCKRIVYMLLVEWVPQEFRNYAKLLRRIGLGSWWPVIESQVSRENPYVMRHYRYLRNHCQRL